MTDLKAELARLLPAEGHLDLRDYGLRITLDRTGKSIPFGYSGFPPMGCRPDCPNTGDPHVLGRLLISRTELYDLSLLRIGLGRLFILEF